MIFRMLCVASLLTFSAPGIKAQSSSTGRVTGQVTDRQGAPIEGAEVVLTDPATNSVQRTVTNEVGRYLILNVHPGIYDLAVSMSGFSQARLKGQTVAVGLELTLNTVLEIGSVSTSIDVQAVRGRGVADVEFNGRFNGRRHILDESSELRPRRQRVPRLATCRHARRPSRRCSSDQSQFQLDGGNNSDDQEGGHGYNIAPGNLGIGGATVPTGVMPTPVETIEEFKVGIANQSADFNGAAGSQVQMVSKRGTNQFHGAGYDHYFAGNLGANNLARQPHNFRRATVYSAAIDSPEPFRRFRRRTAHTVVLGRQDLFPSSPMRAAGSRTSAPSTDPCPPN